VGGTARIAYSGEVWTVMGVFNPPAAGDYTLACEGSNANAYTVSLVALQG
jgi:hypothetical protein